MSDPGWLAAWSVALGGTTTIALAGDRATVTVEGSLDSAGTWTLSGGTTARFEPMAAVIGAGRFVVAAPSFTVSVPAAGAPAITLTATMELCLLGSCAPGSALTAFVRGGLVGPCGKEQLASPYELRSDRRPVNKNGPRFSSRWS